MVRATLHTFNWKERRVYQLNAHTIRVMDRSKLDMEPVHRAPNHVRQMPWPQSNWEIGQWMIEKERTGNSRSQTTRRRFLTVRKNEVHMTKKGDFLKSRLLNYTAYSGIRSELKTICLPYDHNFVILHDCRVKWKAMNPPPVPPFNRGKGKPKHSKGDGDSSETSISWQADLQRTNKLVDFLVNNAVDCRILFSSEGKKPTDPNIKGPPLGKDKDTIHAVIADVIFSGDKVYVGQYAANRTRFHDSVANCITVLWNKFHEYHNEFESTGAGIVPLDVGTAENPHAKVKKEFPWYDNLYKIWGSNPSFAAKTTSSRPGTDHGGDLFALIPSPPSQFAPHQFDFAPPHQSGQQGGIAGSHPHVPAPQFNFTALPQNAQPGNVSGSPQHWNYGLPPQGTYASGVTGSLPTPQYNFTPPPQSVPPSSTSGSPQHWNYDLSPQGAQSQSCNAYSPGPPTLSDFPGMGDDNDNPLADDMEDLHMDESVAHQNLNGVARNASSLHLLQLHPPLSFAALQKPRTSTHDGRSSFKSHAGHVMECEGATSSTPSVASLKTSHSSLGRGQSDKQGSSVQQSPTSQTSVSAKPKGKDSVSKRIRLEIQEQVKMLNDDLESIHSEKVSLYQLKNERLMVKMNSNHQQKEHDFICEEHANECADAAIVHQRMKEAKETEIRLCEADAKVLEMERDLMRLRIEWAKLNAGKND
ncbi:hypothetical protein F4604DRAFT_1675359 [Suillus subluteus]|nr:hypothetical protein F4604DRAFT_1675359 [Suillus subluteus]